MMLVDENPSTLVSEIPLRPFSCLHTPLSHHFLDLFCGFCWFSEASGLLINSLIDPGEIQINTLIIKDSSLQQIRICGLKAKEMMNLSPANTHTLV